MANKPFAVVTLCVKTTINYCNYYYTAFLFTRVKKLMHSLLSRFNMMTKTYL